MILKRSILISSLLLSVFMRAQSVSHVYKIGDLLKRMDTTKTELVVNFWATWCKPCVQELPAFDSLSRSGVKVILVSMDFKEDLEKVNAFIKKHLVSSECVLLDEVNGNDFIDKISPSWSGAIPGTLFKKREKSFFVEKKMKLVDLQKHLGDLRTK